eukprot:10431099-Lingulodinium_polyedra.AAC.1
MCLPQQTAWAGPGRVLDTPLRKMANAKKQRAPTGSKSKRAQCMEHAIAALREHGATRRLCQ